MESQIWVASPGNGVQRSVQGCAKVCGWVRTCVQVVAPGDGVVGGWSRWYGCMPSAPRGENSKIFECVPVLTGLTAKNRLRVDWRGVGVVAQGQGMDGGVCQVSLGANGSPGGW